jgi:hypothetical protein
VDLQPIKQVLTTYAAKWMWTYTKYLSDQVGVGVSVFVFIAALCRHYDYFTLSVFENDKLFGYFS